MRLNHGDIMRYNLGVNGPSSIHKKCWNFLLGYRLEATIKKKKHGHLMQTLMASPTTKNWRQHLLQGISSPFPWDCLTKVRSRTGDGENIVTSVTIPSCDVLGSIPSWNFLMGSSSPFTAVVSMDLLYLWIYCIYRCIDFL